jgi:hypothetical protein
MGPLSTLALAVVGVLQAVFSARAATMSAWVWGIAGAIIFCEFIWTWKPTRCWPLTRKIPTCVGIIILVFGLIRWQISIPNISVTVDNNRAYVTKASDETVWLRFSVTFDGQAKAICRTYLDQLYEMPNQTPLIEKFHLLLSAEDGGEPGVVHGFTFYNGTERFFNLAYVTPEHKLFMAAKTYRDMTSAPLSPGTYKAKIEVNGDKLWAVL